MRSMRNITKFPVSAPQVVKAGISLAKLQAEPFGGRGGKSARKVREKGRRRDKGMACGGDGDGGGGEGAGGVGVGVARARVATAP